MKKIKQKNIILGLFSRGRAGRGETSGFSLVEMLVAIAVFMSIMTVALSALISIISANKKSQAIKSTVDNVTFAIESISKDMRVGSNYKCINSAPEAQEVYSKNCSSATGYNKIAYKSGSGEWIKYYFNSTEKSLKRFKCNEDLLTCPKSEYLISPESNVNMSAITFYVFGAENEFNANPLLRTQPRVIITASGLISLKGSPDVEFNLQTNISQRMRGEVAN